MRLIRISRFIITIAFPLLAFPAIAWAQIGLGHEFALFPLYMVPVGVLAWELGWKGAIAGVILGMAFWRDCRTFHGRKMARAGLARKEC